MWLGTIMHFIQISFPEDTLVVRDRELLSMHNERYERTIKDSSGKLQHMAITNHLGRKCYLIN